ncbi:MAG: aspartate aminotransferase family protein [Acidilobaceae archaeon]
MASLDDLTAQLESLVSERTRGSRVMYERALRVLPGGTTYHIRWFPPYPLFVSRGKGSRVWDVDGNVYDDYWMGHGSLILGHSPELVVEAVAEALRDGSHLGFENPYALEYAELLTKIVPGLEMVRFTNSGTEANMYALRLARAFTGRKYVVKIEGGWHGGLDALHTGVTPPFEGPESLGLLEDFIKYTLTVPFNDVEALEAKLREFDVAAVIVEPVPGAGGALEPEKGYLEELRRLTEEHGALLIFDEVITGFRLSLGGAQEYFGVKADIVTLGKIIGGGMPGAGAFGGREEVMRLLDHLREPNPRRRSFHGGTFTGNPVTCAAGLATVRYLASNKHLYESFNSLWESTARKIDSICEEADRICWVTNVASMIGIHFTTKKPRNVREAYATRRHSKLYTALHLYARLKGVLYMTEKMPHLLPSMAHTPSQAERLVEVLAEALETLRRHYQARS